MIYRCRITEGLEFNMKAKSEEDAMDWLLSHSTQDVFNRNKSLMDNGYWDEQILYSTDEDDEDADIDITEED